MKLRAIRGATTAETDTAGAILTATAELIKELLGQNELDSQDLVSIIFTATPDLSAAFPAAAARELGLGEVPLLCATEMNVDSATPKCIRILIHAYTEREVSEIRHVYLGGARNLRNDLAG